VPAEPCKRTISVTEASTYTIKLWAAQLNVVVNDNRCTVPLEQAYQNGKAFIEPKESVDDWGKSSLQKSLGPCIRRPQVLTDQKTYLQGAGLFAANNPRENPRWRISQLISSRELFDRNNNNNIVL